jgi:hypothetical protein
MSHRGAPRGSVLSVLLCSQAGPCPQAAGGAKNSSAMPSGSRNETPDP